MLGQLCRICLSVPAPFCVSEAMLVVRAESVETRVDDRADADPARLADRHTRTVVDLERAHGQVLFGFVRRLGVSDSAASDVVQESLLRLFRQLVDGAAINDPKAWTFHTAYRLAMDEHRRFARVTRLVARLPGSRSTATDDPSLGLERELVWAEVDRLPQRQRAVLYLRFRADLDFDAVGQTMGITANAARSHCTQALATLRSRLAEERV
jgi:RNA polymerase sigma factor (sigma-70 family)